MSNDKNPKLSVSDEELRSRREEIAVKLYGARHNTPEHTMLERDFNEVERELFVRGKNDPAIWKYKHDLRHCFRFTEKTDVKGIVELRAEMAISSDGKTEYTHCFLRMK